MNRIHQTKYECHASLFVVVAFFLVSMNIFFTFYDELDSIYIGYCYSNAIKRKKKTLLWKHEITFSVINSSTTVNGDNGHTSKSCQLEKIEMCTTRASYGCKSVLTA